MEKGKKVFVSSFEGLCLPCQPPKIEEKGRNKVK